MNSSQIKYHFLPKSLLQRINLWLQRKNSKRSPNIWHSVYKWNYDNHLVKNLLQLFNKTLKGLNKYHVFRGQYVYTFVGMGLGYLVYQMQNKFDQIQNLEFQPLVLDIVKQKVLRNEQIMFKLKEALNENVFRNQDIQTNLHFILINKVLIPQRQNLSNLVKNALLSLLRSEEMMQLAQQKAAQAIKENTGVIARQSLQFLNSQLMLNIIKRQVAPLIKGQAAQRGVSSQLIKIFACEMQKQENKQKVYDFIRQKII